ncbi:MAG TPA: hypothetical protein VFJ64_08540 [Solirubrobacterales bacterium]|nr:hypothetical protein [Solirubrobacterales bacterium]
MLISGSLIGIVLLILDAPLWAFYVAPLAASPVLVIWLRRLHPPASHRESDSVIDVRVIEAYVDPGALHQLLVAVRNKRPENPYFALSNQFSASRSNEFSTYVVSGPSEDEQFRAQRLRLLGINTALVDDSSGELIFSREPGMSPAVKVSHVAVDAEPPVGGGDKWLLMPGAIPEGEPKEGLDPDLSQSPA